MLIFVFYLESPFLFISPPSAQLTDTPTQVYQALKCFDPLPFELHLNCPFQEKAT